jgi:hypothetical protein
MEDQEAELAQLAEIRRNEKDDEGMILQALRLLVEEIRETDKEPAPAPAPAPAPEYSARVAHAVQSLATAMSDSDGYNKLEVLEEVDSEELALSLVTLRSAVAQALNVLCADDVRCSNCGNPLDNTDPTDNLCEFCVQAGLELDARAANSRDLDASRGIN